MKETKIPVRQRTTYEVLYPWKEHYFNAVFMLKDGIKRLERMKDQVREYVEERDKGYKRD